MPRTYANVFKYPEDTPDFSEMIGIILGDGCITKGQIHITLNSTADKFYIEYVSSLINKLFDYNPYIRPHHTSSNATIIICSGVDLIRFLISKGMMVGSKTANQVNVPLWIRKSKILSGYCLRGLIDTDGGIFRHTYKVNGKTYSYFKLCFSNTSQPLRIFAHQTLSKYGLKPKLQDPKHVWLYSQDETKKYLELIGSSNQRLLNKIQ